MLVQFDVLMQINDPVTFLFFVGASVNGGLQLDFTQQIVNVQWGGLAVMFGKEDDPPP